MIPVLRQTGVSRSRASISPEQVRRVFTLFGNRHSVASLSQTKSTDSTPAASWHLKKCDRYDGWVFEVAGTLGRAK
jgi:hypothetical protein